jgi:hypothetical protein
VVQSPAYRDDKRGTTLDLLPELLAGTRSRALTRLAGPEVVVDPPVCRIPNRSWAERHQSTAEPGDDEPRHACAHGSLHYEVVMRS